MKKIIIILLSTCIFGCNNTNREVNQQMDKDMLKVAIAVPEYLSESSEQPTRIINLLYDRMHFHVIITNISSKPQRVWTPWNSWGYDNLSFEIINKTQGKSIINKISRVWGKNFPSFFELKPEEHFVIDVNFDKEWDKSFFRELKKSDFSIQMRAIYDISKDESTSRFGIWTGKIISEFEEYKISIRNN